MPTRRRYIAKISEELVGVLPLLPSKMRRKIIFHIHIDQLFVAVELLRQPHLRGKPVAIGSAGSRGMITSPSHEARAYGISAGTVIREALRLCPNLVVISPDLPRYLQVSRRIFELLFEFTCQVEPISVDEACMEVTDAVRQAGGPEVLASAIKQRILDAEGVTVSIGAGSNRMVAKVACDVRKPEGFTYIPAERVGEVFRDLPIRYLSVVGRATQSILESFGIHTIGQLASFPREPLRRRLGKWGEELIRIANGCGSEEVLSATERLADKSIGHVFTFSRDLTDAGQVSERLRLIVERIGRRLRAAGLAAAAVTLKLRYHELDTYTHGRRLKRHLQSEADIFAIAHRLFVEVYSPVRPVPLVGVYVSNLVPLSQIAQQELFTADTELADLYRIRNELHARLGNHVINYADILRPRIRAAKGPGARGDRVDSLLRYTGAEPLLPRIDEAPDSGGER